MSAIADSRSDNIFARQDEISDVVAAIAADHRVTGLEETQPQLDYERAFAP